MIEASNCVSAPAVHMDAPITIPFRHRQRRATWTGAQLVLRFPALKSVANGSKETLRGTPRRTGLEHRAAMMINIGIPYTHS
jgi:hypothetical protein